MSNEIRSGYYRVSVKALVLNETRDKFLIIQEDNGRWDIPGGGLDWGAVPQIDLAREIDEEMKLEIAWVAEHPSYFLTSMNWRGDLHIVNVLYETELTTLDFTPSSECVGMQFVDADDLQALDAVCPNVTVLAAQFDPKRHVRE